MRRMLGPMSESGEAATPAGSSPRLGRRLCENANAETNGSPACILSTCRWTQQVPVLEPETRRMNE